VILYAKKVHFLIVATTQKTGSRNLIASFALVDLSTFEIKYVSLHNA
jgi:hypothetical protein